MMETKETYVLIKRDLFWRPRAEGYTGVLSLAGHFTKGDGIMDSYALLDEYSPKHERLTPYAIPLSAAPEFTQSCNSDIERDCLRARNTSLLSVQKQLVEALEKIAEREAPDFDEDMTSYEKQIYWEARANWFQREARAAILAAKASS